MLTMNSTASEREERHPDAGPPGLRRRCPRAGRRLGARASGVGARQGYELVQRTDRRTPAAAVARDQHGADARGARALDVGLRRVARRARPAPAARRRARAPRGRWRRRAWPSRSRRRRSRRRRAAASPVSCEPLVQRPVPVGDDRGPDPGARAAPAARARCPRRRRSAATPAGRPGRPASRTAAHRLRAADRAGPAATPGRGPRAGAPGSRRSRPGSRPRRPARRCRRRSARAAPPAGAARAARR